MRRKRQRRWSMIKWLLILAALGAAFYFAYETARQLARIEVEQLEDRVATLENRLQDSGEEKRALRNDLEATQEKLAQWRQRYQQEVPEGEPAELLDLVRARLEEGVSADRLGFVIHKASTERECTGGPVTKRFIVQTPLSTGASSSVSFASRRITVTAGGPSATNAQGQPEAWYDPSAELTATFYRVGGENEQVKGKLPINYSVVIGDQEHRFTITEGDNRAFARVTWESCAYP
ncbi:hypothetical protein [Rhodovibrio salinarum]|nr:hypothetical protein [Rhodovibrio salinarum]